MADNPRAVPVCGCRSCSQGLNPELAQYHAAINAVLPELHERNRRLFAGLLASEHGHGGIVLLAQVTGLSRTTILRGNASCRMVSRWTVPASAGLAAGGLARKKKSG
jgi:hypothetical protein